MTGLRSKSTADPIVLEALQNAIKKHGSMTKAAKHFKVSIVCLSHIGSGRREPSAALMRKLKIIRVTFYMHDQ